MEGWEGRKGGEYKTHETFNIIQYLKEEHQVKM